MLHRFALFLIRADGIGYAAVCRHNHSCIKKEVIVINYIELWKERVIQSSIRKTCRATRVEPIDEREARANLKWLRLTATSR